MINRKFENDHIWKLEILKFITQNSDAIFSEEEDKRQRMRSLITMCFPKEILNVIFQNLEVSSKTTNQKEFWKDSQIIHPKASATILENQYANSGRQLYKFSLWFEVPDVYKNKIKSIKYLFNHPSFVKDKIKESSNSTNGFEVDYVGWGALSTIVATLIMQNNETQLVKIDIIELLGW